MSVALHGNLRDFGIGEVFQLIGQQRKTGVLEIEGEGEPIAVVFDEGSVVSAAAAAAGEHGALGDFLVRSEILSAEQLVAIEGEAATSELPFPRLLVRRTDLSAEEVQRTEDLLTQETIFTLLRLRDGSFHFRPQTVQHSREGARLLPAEEILMDGLRMLDEWRTLDADATREDAVFRRCGRFENYEEWAKNESPEKLAAAERIFISVDGRETVRRIIDLGRTGTFEGARILTALRRSGVIEPVDPASLPRLRRRPRAASELLLGALGRLGAAAPFGVLALWAWLALVPGAAPPESGRFEVPRDALAAARASLATERIRNLAEAHRFATGAWPRDLRDLANGGWLGEDALAAADSDPYYFAEGEGGVLVLAPVLAPVRSPVR